MDVTITVPATVAMQMQAALATRSAKLVDIADLCEDLDSEDVAVVQQALRDTIAGLASIVKALYPDDATVEAEWNAAQRELDRLQGPAGVDQHVVEDSFGRPYGDLAGLADGDHHVGLGHLESSRYRTLDQVATGTGIDLAKMTYEGME